MADPSTLGATGWWTAKLGVTESGGAVSNWADQIASADFFQASGTNQPTYSATTFGPSLPGVTFDGVNDWMDNAGGDPAAFGSTGAAYSYAGVFNWLTAPSTNTTNFDSNANLFNDFGGFWGLFARNNNLIGAGQFSGGSSQATQAFTFDSTLHYFIVWKASGTVHFNLDGVEVTFGSGTPGWTSPNTLRMGQQSNNSRFANAGVAEFSTYDFTLSPTDITDLVDYFTLTWFPSVLDTGQFQLTGNEIILPPGLTTGTMRLSGNDLVIRVPGPPVPSPSIPPGQDGVRRPLPLPPEPIHVPTEPWTRPGQHRGRRS